MLAQLSLSLAGLKVHRYGLHCLCVNLHILLSTETRSESQKAETVTAFVWLQVTSAVHAPSPGHRKPDVPAKSSHLHHQFPSHSSTHTADHAMTAHASGAGAGGPAHTAQMFHPHIPPFQGRIPLISIVFVHRDVGRQRVQKMQ